MANEIRTVLETILRHLDRADDDAAHRIIEGCRTMNPGGIAIEEIAYFTEVEAQAISTSAGVAKPIPVLVGSVVRAAQGQRLALYRDRVRREAEEREQRQAEENRIRQADLAEARRILADDKAEELDRLWAAKLINGEGN